MKTEKYHRTRHFKKGHPGYYKGKKMDVRVFKVSYNAYGKGEINKEEFAGMCGITVPTLNKRLNELWTNGYLPDYLFTQGKPLWLEGYDGGFNKYGEGE